MHRGNDYVHISRTHGAGLGLSVLRDGELVAAAGTVMHVPLGPTVTVRHPLKLIEQAEAIFRTQDPKYRMGSYPVELQVDVETCIRHSGRPTIGDYEIIVRHGHIWGIPGRTSACRLSDSGSAPARRLTTRRS